MMHTIRSKIVGVVVAIAVVCMSGCTTIHRAESVVQYPTVDLWDLPYNEQVIIAPAVTQVDLAQSYALHEAAVRIAMMQTLFVFSGQVSRVQGSRTTHVTNDFSFNYDDSIIPQITEMLTIKETVMLPDGSRKFRISYAGLSDSQRTDVIPGAISLTRNAGDRPLWLSSIPHFDGYDCAYGMVPPHRSYSDALFAADLDAAAVLIRQKKSTVHNYAFAKSNEQSHKTETLQDGSALLAAGHLDGFYILDRWIDPKTGKTYSLAICR